MKELPTPPCSGIAMLPKYGAFSVLLQTAKQAQDQWQSVNLPSCMI